MDDLVKINFGCGLSPTEGYLNYDNSPSVKLARMGFLSGLLCRFGLLNADQKRFVDFCRTHDIRWGNPVKGIKMSDGTAAVIYSSHMMEHLDKSEAKRFLQEAWRLLVSGGVIRLALPDLKKYANEYLERGDADLFISNLHVCCPKPKGFVARLKACLVGGRHHHWMYDEASLCGFLAECGFADARSLRPGETTINEPGVLNLSERVTESIYVEARKP